jgi:hypothetical protein
MLETCKLDKSNTPIITSQIEALAIELQLLHEEIDSLQQKLEPVLSPDTPDKSISEAEPPLAVPLAEGLRSLVYKVKHARYRVGAIRERTGL